LYFNFLIFNFLTQKKNSIAKRLDKTTNPTWPATCGLGGGQTRLQPKRWTSSANYHKPKTPTAPNLTLKASGQATPPRHQGPSPSMQLQNEPLDQAFSQPLTPIIITKCSKNPNIVTFPLNKDLEIPIIIQQLRFPTLLHIVPFHLPIVKHPVLDQHVEFSWVPNATVEDFVVSFTLEGPYNHCANFHPNPFHLVERTSWGFCQENPLLSAHHLPRPLRILTPNQSVQNMDGLLPSSLRRDTFQEFVENKIIL